MHNEEILNRFDVLYNNIMSNQAPGLDGYEKSVFWNKSTLEVLKNHLNPKGNKYAEGFDNNSKRQIEFSDLVVDKSYSLFPNKFNDLTHTSWSLSKTELVHHEADSSYEVVDIDIDYSSMLCILNESLDVADNELDYYVKAAKTLMIGDAASFDYNKDGMISVGDVAAIINAKLKGLLPEHVDPAELVNFILSGRNKDENGAFVLQEPKTPEEIIESLSIETKRLIVVPINYVEYDTLMSRPYKYPTKSQAWRLFINGKSKIIIDPNYAPYKYNIRYVKIPAEVNLESDVNSEVPEVLHDEILQRAVELAKNSWEGNIETAKSFGERSE